MGNLVGKQTEKEEENAHDHEKHGTVGDIEKANNPDSGIDEAKNKERRAYGQKDPHRIIQCNKPADKGQGVNTIGKGINTTFASAAGVPVYWNPFDRIPVFHESKGEIG